MGVKLGEMVLFDEIDDNVSTEEINV